MAINVYLLYPTVVKDTCDIIEMVGILTLNTTIDNNIEILLVLSTKKCLSVHSCDAHYKKSCTITKNQQ